MASIAGEDEIPLSSVHLDAVRGTAALVVVLGHLRELYFSSLTAPRNSSGSAQGTTQNVTASSAALAVPTHGEARGRLTIGHEAVMIFFVLSGYLVGGTVLRSVTRNKWSWKIYLSKRFTRLWVVLLPALLFGLMIDTVGLRVFPAPTSIYAGPAGQTTVPRNIAETTQPKVILGNALFVQTILVPPAGTNIPLWSLANEFWYYAAFPLLILGFAGTTRLWLRGCYLVLFALIAFGVGKSIALLFPIWAVGAIISTLPLKIPKGVAQPLAWVFAAITIVSLVLFRVSSLSVGGAEWGITLVFSCLLYLLLHSTQAAQAGLYRAVAGFFSRISYTLYLVHLPLAVFLCACINNPWHKWTKTIPHISVVTGVTAVIVLFAYGFYWMFESNTDRVRIFLMHRLYREPHVPGAQTTKQ
jgi:peptidoglycan/LPS O-acetylase OafA/YrhL